MFAGECFLIPMLPLHHATPLFLTFTASPKIRPHVILMLCTSKMIQELLLILLILLLFPPTPFVAPPPFLPNSAAIFF